MDRTGKRHPANDTLAHLMNLLALAFGLSCLWFVTSAVKL